MFGLIKKIFICLLTGLVNGSNHKKCVSFSNQKFMIQLINTVKNFTTIHFQSNSIDVLKVAILCLIYLINYVFQIKQKI